MPDTRLTKQAFLENCALATRPGRTSCSSACWAAQVCSFLHFTSPIVDGKPQRIDTSAVSAHLQRRMYDAVNGSDLRKVREWLEVRGPVNCDNYQMAHYLQAVASVSVLVSVWVFVCHLTFDIDYILVVGQFGLATGSGGKNPERRAQRVVSETVHSPLIKSWSTQTRLEPYPSSSAQ